MGLSSLFQRKAATAAHVVPVVEAAAHVPDAPMSPELQEELRIAWAELTEGLKDEFASRPEWHEAIMGNIDTVLEHIK